MTEYKRLLEGLCAIPSVSGFERAGHAEALKTIGEGLFDEVRTDARGNLLLIRRSGKPGAPLLLLDAHFDEIGMMVSELLDGGFVRLVPVGGLDARVLPAAELTLHGLRELPATIVSTPPHLQKKGDSAKLVPPDKLLADTGLPLAELEKLVSVGTTASLRAQLTELKNGLIAGRSFDDKACAACAVRAVQLLRESGSDADVCVLLSAGEETGTDGARNAAYALRPDAALVLDVNFGTAPEVPKHKSAKLGEGPSISISAVTDRGLTDALIAFAASKELPLQTIVEPMNTGTNAELITLAGEGVPAAVVSLPLRNMHTAAELISLDDALALSKLIARFAGEGGFAGWLGR